MARSDAPAPKSGRRLVRLSAWPDPNDPNWPGFNEAQRANLLELLAPLLESVNGNEVLREIESAVADCKMWRAAGINAPAATTKRTTAKIAALRKAAQRLREAVEDLDDESIEVLRFSPGASWAELLKHASRSPRIALYGARIDHGFLDHLSHAAAYAEGGAAVGLAHVERLIPATEGGRPRYVAEMDLVRTLSDVWRRATGRSISRQNREEGREFEDDGAFLRFVREVLPYTQPPKRVDGAKLVRRAEKELKARGGRPYEADEELSAEELAACGLNPVENG